MKLFKNSFEILKAFFIYKIDLNVKKKNYHPDIKFN